MRAAVLAVAVVARLAAEESFLAVADDRNPVRPDALSDEIVHRRARAPIAQREVVLGGAALVRVPLDENLPLGVGLQHHGVCFEDLRIFRPDIVPIELEVDIPQVPSATNSFGLGRSGLPGARPAPAVPPMDPSAARPPSVVPWEPGA